MFTATMQHTHLHFLFLYLFLTVFFFFLFRFLLFLLLLLLLLFIIHSSLYTPSFQSPNSCSCTTSLTEGPDSVAIFCDL